jgi:quercetin dioxygenase-like cupin family protein
VIIKNIRDVKGYDVKEAYGQDAEGEEYLHNFALRYFVIEPSGYLNPHKHPWEQEIAVTRGRLQVLGHGKGGILGVGDVAYFPANEEHGFKTIGDEPSEFYCVIGCIGKGENCLGISEP